jgi:hypothetical protein
VTDTGQNAPVGRRVITPGLAVVYVVASALIALTLKTTRSDLDLFFWPSAETVVAGHPLLIYAAHAHDIYPNANGPLGLVPLVPIAALANALGWAGSLGPRAAITDAMVALFAVLLAYQSVRLIALARGVTEWPLAVAATLLLAPTLWIAVLEYGHVEQPVEICLLLLAVSCALADRSLGAGVALGAAMLARTTAAFCVIPFVVLPIGTRRPRSALVTVVVAGVAVVAGLTPLLLADASAVVHSLFTYRGSLPIESGSFWFVVRETALAGFAQRGDVYVAAAVAFAITGVVLRRKPALATAPAGLIGLLVISTCCFPLFAKAVFPYYFFEAYVFGVVWWLARPGTALTWRLIVPALLTAETLLTNTVVGVFSGAWASVEGVASSAILAVVIGLVTVDLLRRSPAVAARVTTDAVSPPVAKLVGQP